MKRFAFPVVFLALAVPLMADSCDDNSADGKMARAQEQMSSEAASQVGMPAIINFQEKRMMKQILELRDTAISTTTYIATLDGRLLKVCNSVGYGLPYATQFTSPQKYTYAGNGNHVVLPQADPNGLFSPLSAEGTWVLCKNPAGKDVMPVYVEPRIVVSPFALNVEKAGG